MEWFLHIAALSSVLAKPIFSVYPNCNTWIRDFMHSELSPRNAVSSEPLFLLWSREGNLDNRAGAWFVPNHFVPLYSTRENMQRSQPQKPGQETIQGNTDVTVNLASGSTFPKETTAKTQPSINNAMPPKRGCLEAFGFIKGKSKRSKGEDSTLPPSSTSQLPTGVLLKSHDLQKQAEKETPSMKRKFNPTWKKEFPWLSFDVDKNLMICDLCCAHPSVAGKTDFLKGCSTFKKETIRKHAKSNGHKRARDKSLSEEKSPAESQIIQSFSKINKEMQFQERKEMVAKINTAYFVAKEEIPFSKFEGLISLQRKNGVNINQTYANEKSCAELVSFLSTGFREDLVRELNSKNYFSVMADGAADFGGVENETIVCRFVRDGLPVNCMIGHKAVAHAHAEGKFP